MRFYTVEFVYSDEATPRDTHTRTVKATDAADAEKIVQINAILSGDRVMITGAMTNS